MFSDSFGSWQSGIITQKVQDMPLPGVSFTEFTLLSSDDVATAVPGLPDKSSAIDPIPVPVLKAISDLLVPFLTYLFNYSLTTGCVPAGFKNSFVTPIVKEPRLG